MGRGQLSISLVEASVGVVFVLAVTSIFATGLPAPDDRATQLDVYAADVGSVLVGEPPRHADETRLSEVTASAEAYARERGALARRLDRLVPENLLYRVETPHGAVGYRPPDGVVFGTTRVPTPGGLVTIRVWYA
jgi:hypothetical protein